MSSGTTPGSETTPETGTAGAATPAEQSRRMIEAGFNEGRFDLVDQLVAPDAVAHDPSLPPRLRSMRGPELEKAMIRMYRAAFPDVRLTVDEVVDGDDTVALRWRADGTHRGELEGLAPTGVRASVTGISIDHWRDGKIVETWTQWDNLGLGRQIGAAPPEGHPVEKVGIAVQRLMAPWMRKKNQ